jgi:hypothetical protein
MFRKPSSAASTPAPTCSEGHEEVRWSMMAPDSHRCWYCNRDTGVTEHVALVITSNLPPFAPGSHPDIVARSVAA